MRKKFDSFTGSFLYFFCQSAFFGYSLNFFMKIFCIILLTIESHRRLYVELLHKVCIEFKASLYQQEFLCNLYIFCIFPLIFAILRNFCSLNLLKHPTYIFNWIINIFSFFFSLVQLGVWYAGCWYLHRNCSAWPNLSDIT